MNYLTEEELELCDEVRVMCACNQLRKGARGLTKLYDMAMVGSDLKVTQLPILVALALKGDTPITTLARTVGLDRTTLTRNVAVLEHRGLVRTYEREDDARVRIIAFTLEGSRALSAALSRWEMVQAEVEAKFGRDRLRSLYRELDALTVSIGA